jgi:hypothetical protein
LSKLVLQWGEINKSVTANAADADLKKMITEAHHIFQYTTGECKKAND